jgi:hypothetical protein
VVAEDAEPGAGHCFDFAVDGDDYYAVAFSEVVRDVGVVREVERSLVAFGGLDRDLGVADGDDRAADGFDLDRVPVVVEEAEVEVEEVVEAVGEAVFEVGSEVVEAFAEVALESFEGLKRAFGSLA